MKIRYILVNADYKPTNIQKIEGGGLFQGETKMVSVIWDFDHCIFRWLNPKPNEVGKDILTMVGDTNFIPTPDALFLETHPMIIKCAGSNEEYFYFEYDKEELSKYEEEEKLMRLFTGIEEIMFTLGKISEFNYKYNEELGLEVEDGKLKANNRIKLFKESKEVPIKDALIIFGDQEESPKLNFDKIRINGIDLELNGEITKISSNGTEKKYNIKETIEKKLVESYRMKNRKLVGKVSRSFVNFVKNNSDVIHLIASNGSPIIIERVLSQLGIEKNSFRVQKDCTTDEIVEKMGSGIPILTFLDLAPRFRTEDKYSYQMYSKSHDKKFGLYKQCKEIIDNLMEKKKYKQIENKVVTFDDELDKYIDNFREIFGERNAVIVGDLGVDKFSNDKLLQDVIAKFEKENLKK